jgi:hypothetical protein
MRSLAKVFRRFAPIAVFGVLICCGSSQSGTGVTSAQAPAASGPCALKGEACHANGDCCTHNCFSGSCFPS